MVNYENMLPVGTKLRNGKYVIKRQLGSGGFGNTYLVIDVNSGIQYAIKEFFMKECNLRAGTTVTVSISSKRSTFENQKVKFLKEAERLRKFNHAHIVRVHESFEEKNTAYYVMDYIDGGSLKEQLAITNRPLSKERAVSILQQILSALTVVHEQHINHMDIKPDNILLDNKGCAYLIDFGASKFVESDGRFTSTAVPYTSGYAPNEQIEGNLKHIGPWTDLYALGATLYNMLTLQRPPMSSDIMDNGDSAFIYPYSVSENLKKLIRWMMQPKRSERPQAVCEVENYLSKFFYFSSEATQYTKGYSTYSTRQEDTIYDSHDEETSYNLISDDNYPHKKNFEETILNADNQGEQKNNRGVTKDKLWDLLWCGVFLGLIFGGALLTSRCESNEVKKVLESDNIEVMQKWIDNHSAYSGGYDKVKKRIEEIKMIRGDGYKKFIEETAGKVVIKKDTSVVESPVDNN